MTARNNLDERQFYETLDRWRARPYDWIRANCCQFVADVGLCWGIEFVIPKLETPDEAVTWIRDQGHRSLYHFLVHLFGKPKAPLSAKRGWIVYRKGVGLEGAAIGTVDRKALFVGENGLIQNRLSTCTWAFDPSLYRG